jgi:hypothetical protein
MSIRTINIEHYTQCFDINIDYKTLYGEVTTDFKLIEKMLSLIHTDAFNKPDKKWLDPCCGHGYFMIYLYKKLFRGLEVWEPNDDKRHEHIIKNMLFMIEINGEYIPTLREIFGNNANIYHEDFLSTEMKGFDFVIGNPPFNVGGLVKVPTNTQLNKKGDGRAIWMQFITKSLNCLKGRGILVMITPSIWMKRDHKMYKIMLQYNIKQLHTLTNTETNKIFHGHAQTPTCYFSLMKLKKTNKHVNLFDKGINNYVEFPIQSSIPLFAASILKKLQVNLNSFGPIVVKKTNMPHPSITFANTQTEIFSFPNIKTCIIKDKIKPELVINYSNKECVFSNTPKLVLAHKMYGFPYYDVKGNYGISNRDNYVIYGRTDRDFRILKAFLSTKLALYLFEGTRYRMKYLEKYIFEMIPDISKDSTIKPEDINDEWLIHYFLLSDVERLAIENHTKKTYYTFS